MEKLSTLIYNFATLINAQVSDLPFENEQAYLSLHEAFTLIYKRDQAVAKALKPELIDWVNAHYKWEYARKQANPAEDRRKHQDRQKEAQQMASHDAEDSLKQWLEQQAARYPARYPVCHPDCVTELTELTGISLGWQYDGEGGWFTPIQPLCTYTQQDGAWVHVYFPEHQQDQQKRAQQPEAQQKTQEARYERYRADAENWILLGCPAINIKRMGFNEADEYYNAIMRAFNFHMQAKHFDVCRQLERIMDYYFPQSNTLKILLQLLPC